MDLAVVGLLAAFIYALVTVAHEWNGPLRQVPEIHLEARYLPLYALFSLSRGVLAYGVSFLFTMAYGYAMARVAGAERVMLPVLDILQSIPVLGFLPGFVLGLVHLFPQQNVGLEIASVLMIFTGAGVEHDVLVLLVAKVGAAGFGGGRPFGADVVVGTVLPAGPFLCRNGVALEQHDVDGRGLVLPDGERGVRAGGSMTFGCRVWARI